MRQSPPAAKHLTMFIRKGSYFRPSKHRVRVFSVKVGLAARSGSLFCARVLGTEVIENGYLDQLPVCRAVLSPLESTANCHPEEAT